MLNGASGKLIENITCTEQAFPEFPELLFGTDIDKSVQYFDASDYITKQGLSNYGAEGFFKNYFHIISALVNAYGLDKDKVCVVNQEGHTLINSNLVYLFLCYTNPDFVGHVNDRIHELFRKGFCVSDSYLYNQCKERMSDDILSTIRT